MNSNIRHLSILGISLTLAACGTVQEQPSTSIPIKPITQPAKPVIPQWDKKDTFQDKVDAILSYSLEEKNTKTLTGGQKRITLTLSLENKGPKDISGIRGNLAFYDSFGNFIVNNGLFYTETIKAGTKVFYKTNMSINPSIESHQKFLSLQSQHIHMKLLPRVILFTDKTRLQKNTK